MELHKKTFIGTGVVAAFALFMFIPGSQVQAFPPPDKDVRVVNLPTEAVPVTGTVTVNGSTTVSGGVAATQSGSWNVGAAQNGAWNVGINPAQNTVKVASAPSFFYDSGFSGVNDGQTVDLGPFDLSMVQKARVVVRGVNGEIHCKVIANLAGGNSITIDEFTAGDKGSPAVVSRVYEAPPPSVILRLTESGPGASNSHVLLIGR